ncbi:MAG: hypothetical protein C4303_02800, partial [candidate division GAL15 bacterium]
IHPWWARLPLPVSGAVRFASVGEDSSAHSKKLPTEEAQERERRTALRDHPRADAEAAPTVVGPFRGGGSIPRTGGSPSGGGAPPPAGLPLLRRRATG